MYLITELVLLISPKDGAACSQPEPQPQLAGRPCCLLPGAGREQRGAEGPLGPVPGGAHGASSTAPGLPAGYEAGLALPLPAHDEGLQRAGPQWAGSREGGEAVLHAGQAAASHQQRGDLPVEELLHLCLVLCASFLQPQGPCRPGQVVHGVQCSVDS